MDFPKHIYKAYDIRGLYGTELTEELVYKTARAYAQMRRQEMNNPATMQIVVGADMRTSTPSLKPEVIRGLLDEGITVIDIGLVSTPAFYFAVAKYQYDGGIMVSASHNPPQYNGLKLVRARAEAVSKDSGIFDIRDAVMANNTFDTTLPGGSVKNHTDIVKTNVDTAIEIASLENIKPYKIVADAANSMGATYLRELFKHLPCELIEMNFELDGTFPAHEADPFKEENNHDLMKRVVAEKADLGIATDGDGDRIFFVDNEGQMIEPAIVRGLLAKVFLEEYPGATICYDIRPGKITQDLIEESGGKPCVTKVGHSLIKEQALKVDAVFAGESSGHFFVKMDHGMFEEPNIVVLKLLQYFSRSDQSIADQVRPYRKYAHSGEINTSVKDPARVMHNILEHYKNQANTISELDGVTIEFDDWWFNVRPSNTEPVLRLNLEAMSPEIKNSKVQEVLRLISQSNYQST